MIIAMQQQSTDAQSGQQTGKRIFDITFEAKKKVGGRYGILSTEKLVTVKKHPKGCYSEDV